MNLENIFIRHRDLKDFFSSETKQNMSVVFSFKYINAYPRCYHSDFQVKNIAHIQTCSMKVLGQISKLIRTKDYKIISEYELKNQKKIKVDYSENK